jgi:hypothetical protein
LTVLPVLEPTPSATVFPHPPPPSILAVRHSLRLRTFHKLGGLRHHLLACKNPPSRSSRSSLGRLGRLLGSISPRTRHDDDDRTRHQMEPPRRPGLLRVGGARRRPRLQDRTHPARRIRPRSQRVHVARVLRVRLQRSGEVWESRRSHDRPSVHPSVDARSDTRSHGVGWVVSVRRVPERDQQV